MSQRIGSRWASKDKRDAGKVVEVVEGFGLYGNIVRVVESPSRPDLIGRRTAIQDKTLRATYRLIGEPVEGDEAPPTSTRPVTLNVTRVGHREHEIGPVEGSPEGWDLDALAAEIVEAGYETHDDYDVQVADLARLIRDFYARLPAPPTGAGK